MRDAQKRQAANEEAENRWWRKTVTGEPQPSASADDDDMGNIMLGDNIHPAPVVIAPQQQPQNNSLQTLLTYGALAAATGMGGYMLANRYAPQPAQQPAQVQFDDESVNIGLGRIEDYLKAE